MGELYSDAQRLRFALTALFRSRSLCAAAVSGTNMKLLMDEMGRFHDKYIDEDG